MTMLPTEKIGVTLSGSYTYSRAEMESLSFIHPNWAATDPTIPAYDSDLGSVDDYSDLKIVQYNVDLDTHYDITPNLTLGVGGSVYIYDDNEPYLSDDSGELYIARASLHYSF
jgi:hypothetical protein